MRPRLSLAGLMALVSLAAVGFAILAFTINLQVRPLLTLMIGVLATATMGILFRRETLRAFCLGFALIGWTYLVLTFKSPQALLSSQMTQPLIRLYNSLFGFPMVSSPDDVTPHILRLNDFLRVAHSLVALILAFIGGAVAAGLVTATRRMRDRRSDSLRNARP